MSGHKKVRINPREKILSSDVNKAQSFSHRAVMEVARHLFSTMHNGKEDTQFVSTGTPLRALILSGLCVLPQMGSFDLYVSAGAACTTETPASGDDSAFCFAELTSNYATPGALVMTPNPAGSVRVDVIEFQRVDVTFTTENRDIYNETTKVFDTVNVPKVVGSQIVFRVRAGVAGGGYPGHASGWCPLAIACHAPGSTSNNNVEFFDVRPLVSERENLTNQSRLDTDDYRWVDSTYSGGVGDIRGTYSAFLNGVRVGGLLGAEDDNAVPFDLNDPSGREGTWAMPGAEFAAYLYVLFPHGLPRWCRYWPASSGSRVPGAFSGIPVLSTQSPSANALSTALIVPPLTFGLNVATRGYLFGMFGAIAGAFVVPLFKVYMDQKSVADTDNYLASIFNTSAIAGTMTVPSPTKYVDLYWGTSVAGITATKVLGLTRNFNSDSRSAAHKSSGGFILFEAQYRQIPVRNGQVQINAGLLAENLTDATAIAPVYTHVITPTTYHF